ncbi:MAG: hypothetical protein ACRDSG_00005, partial [Pseudonocardiaceae bacterium]
MWSSRRDTGEEMLAPAGVVVEGGHGVTAFAPTFITGPLDRLAAGLRRAEHAMVAGRATNSAGLSGCTSKGPSWPAHAVARTMRLSS